MDDLAKNQEKIFNISSIGWRHSGHNGFNSWPIKSTHVVHNLACRHGKSKMFTSRSKHTEHTFALGFFETSGSITASGRMNFFFSLGSFSILNFKARINHIDLRAFLQVA